MIYKSITQLIGNTPMIELERKKTGLDVNVFSKLEYLNPFGSLKDRMAWEMIKDNIEEIIKNKKTIIENSSGNTAKALAILSQVFGVNFKIITNRIKFSEKKDVLKISNTVIKELPGKSQCLDPKDPYDPQFFLEKEINESPSKYFFTNQYFNKKNMEAHIKTGEEIIKDLNGKIDYFVSGLGTAGSTLGIKNAFKKYGLKTKMIGVIASGLETIPGIRNKKEMLSVGLFDPKNYDEIIEINPLDAVYASLELINKFGIISGPTGGASYSAIKKYFANKKDCNVVFLACDRYEFYLSYYKKMVPSIFLENQKDEENIFNFNYQSYMKKLKEFEIDAEKIAANLDNYLLVDIRINFSYRFERVKGSINIPEDQLETIINNNFPFPKEKPIVFICPNGERSIKYALYLKTKGYRAFSLKGGIEGLKIKNQFLIDENYYG
jgi:cysteine synthase B